MEQSKCHNVIFIAMATVQTTTKQLVRLPRMLEIGKSLIQGVSTKAGNKIIMRIHFLGKKAAYTPVMEERDEEPIFDASS